MDEKLLEVKNLTIHYKTDDGLVKAVNRVSFDIRRGEVLGLVGETGAGKTTTALGIQRLVPNPPGKVVEGSIYFEGVNLLEIKERDMRKIRGDKITMIFQDPMSSLNPVLTVGDQLMEVIRLHQKTSRKEAYQKAGEMLQRVGISAQRLEDYPHQFSGGMKQRVMIAIALACNPQLLIADEPTTALDVTIQAQVLDLMQKLKQELNTSMLLITHDLGVVANICDSVAIMYAGEIVERGSVQDIFENPKHPYTNGLFAAIPLLDKEVDRLQTIKGQMPDPTKLPQGCKFAPRCPYHSAACDAASPETREVSPGHYVACTQVE